VRAVLFVENATLGGKQYTICRVEEAFDKDIVGIFELKCRSKHPTFKNLRHKTDDARRVQKAGELLYGKLADDLSIQTLFRIMTGPGIYPLCIRSETFDAEQFPWEAMWSSIQQNFIALHGDVHGEGRWPIARLAVPKCGSVEKTVAANELRIAIVLAAAGNEQGAADEWTQICGALPTLGLPVKVLGLVSHDDVRTTMSQHKNVEIKTVGSSAGQLIDAILDHSPHIVHFFCHGKAMPGERPYLGIVTRSGGSITLYSNELSRLGKLRSLWLVVLNCCQGATAASHLSSLAKNLVQDGVPAVVAMRESVAVEDANLFTGHFYPEMFHLLKKDILANVASHQSCSREVDAHLWAMAVQRARRELSFHRGRRPEGCPEWTYPVVYVCRDKLRVIAENPQAPAAKLSHDQRNESEAYLEYLRNFRESPAISVQDGAADLRQALDAEIHRMEQKVRDV